MGKGKKKVIIIAAAILLLACVAVVCFVLFRKPPISQEQAAEVVSSAGKAHSETIRIIEAKEEVYDTAVEFVTTGNLDEANNYFTRQLDYKNSKDYVVQITSYNEAVFKESKANHKEAARLMAECVLIPGAMEKASDYKAMDEIVTLCKTGEYMKAKPLFEELITVSDEQKHSFAFSCKCEYLFWRLEEEDAEEAAQMLAEVMEDPEEVFNNWGSGYDYDTGEYELYGYGYNGAYARRIISYSELGPGKNINLMKMFSDKDEEPDYYYIAVYQYEGKGYYFREFAFSLDGKVLYKPYAKRPSHYAESTS